MKKLLLLTHIFFISIAAQSQYKLQWTFTSLPNFSNPIEMTHAGDGTNRIFVAQQRGIIYVFNNSPSVTTRKIFINLASKVSQGGSETGLLGLAFHTNYENNRYFYVNYTFDSSGSASGYWSRISRFTASQSNPDTALINTEQILITLAQPYSNHNGGKVAFGSDGYLYISFGDGGSGGDPQGNGQSKLTLLGKILRVNVDSSSGGKNYSIPTTNPFYGNIQGYKEEIYAYGLRNTWKFNFDYLTNKLWGADVGQNVYEEVNIIVNGGNYGWNKMEGFHCYGTCDTTGYGFIRPIWEYTHPGGSARSVTGGYVYRGSLLPAFYGKYIYGDYQTGEVWTLTYDGVNPATNSLILDSTYLISSFGEDQNNEIYVLRYSSANGRIYKINNTNAITLNLKAVIEGFYNLQTGKLNIRDTTKVYLRRTVAPYTLADSSNVIMDSVNFSGYCFFNNAANSRYYLQLKHRNGLETWSRTGGDSLYKGGLFSYDFTNDSTKAYGNNLAQKGSIYCIYSGDINQDGIIDGTDNSGVDNDAGAFVTGFQVTDLNADGIVDGSDLLIDDNNAYNFVALIRP